MSDPLPRLGVFLAYAPWTTPAEQLALAQLADRRGLDSIWVAEAWGQESVATLGWLAAQTTQIGIGSALMQIPARPPTTTAMATATLDVLSGGRMRLGLGLSGPRISEAWYGTAYEAPLARTRAYVDVVRRALDGTPVHVELASGAPSTHTEAIRMLLAPVQRPVPVYLGALGPKAIEQCYEIADGWLPFVVGLSMLSEHPRPVRPFDVAPIVPFAVDPDLGAARDAVRPWLAFYFGAMGTPKKHFLVELAERHGHGACARRVQRLFLAGDRTGAAAALTSELIDAAAIATTPDRLRNRVSEFRAAGADTLVAVVLGDRAAAVTALADLRE
jgi:F420-dependent oxidoreductase-like protein